jgi:hypothetical protein
MRILAETDGGTEVLEPESFEAEKELQDLLEAHPELVLTNLADDEKRSIWTIGREVGVPSGSMDLLLLDSRGELWVVEVKLAKNAEVRKQVVGQVLAYASDVAAWDREDVEEVARSYLAGREDAWTSLLDLIGDTVGVDEADALLDRADERLRRGDLTALIVVDELNRVLRRLVEFVNSNSTFELLALKVEAIRHAGARLFVPTVVGATTTTRPPDGKTYADLLDEAPEPVRQLEQRLEALAEENGWAGKVAKRSKTFLLPSGGRMFGFYPAWAIIILDMAPLQSHGLKADADRLLELFSEFSGQDQPPTQPRFNAELLLERWDSFEGEIVPALVEAVAQCDERAAAEG